MSNMESLPGALFVVCDAEENEAASLSGTLKNVPLTLGGLHRLSTEEGHSPPTFFQRCLQCGSEWLKLWDFYHFLVMHSCHFPDFIKRAFPEIQPMSSFFSDLKKDSVSSLSCQMGTPAANSSKFDCDIRVSNGNPTFHPDIQFSPHPAPLTQNLRITRRLPDLTEVPLWQPRAARPQVAFAVGSLQGLSAKNPLEPAHLSKTLFLSRLKYFPHAGGSQRSRSRWMTVAFWRKLAEHQRIGWDLRPFFENSFLLFPRLFQPDRSLNLPLLSHPGLCNPYSAVHYFSQLMLRSLRYLHVPKANEHTYVLICTNHLTLSPGHMIKLSFSLFWNYFALSPITFSMQFWAFLTSLFTPWGWQLCPSRHLCALPQA